MSKITKYMQMNAQLLVAYEYNKWSSIQTWFSTDTDYETDLDYPLYNHTPFLVWQSYTDSDNKRWYQNPMLVDTYMNDKVNGSILSEYISRNDRYNLGISSTAFTDINNLEYYRFGMLDQYSSYLSPESIITKDEYRKILDELEKDRDYSVKGINNSWIQKYYRDEDGNPVFFGLGTGNADGMFYDKIRIYILSGYVFNSLEGFYLRAKVKQRPKVFNLYGEDYKDNIDQWSTLLSFVFHKAEIRNKVKWLPNPFYMSSRFYDRYIDVYMPSPFFLASKLEHMSVEKKKNITDVCNKTHKTDRKNAFITTDTNGYEILEPYAVDMNYIYETNSIETLTALMNIGVNEDIIFEFSPITTENYNEMNALGNSITSSIYLNTNSPLNYFEKECSFLTENTAQGYIKPISNSDYFNAKILQDPETGIIYYSPRFGVTDPDTGDIPLLTKDIMNRINTGIINLYNYGLYDNDYENIDEFEATYGDEASKWVVLNELIVTYYYEDMNFENAFSRSSTFTNTIDYSQDNDEYTYIASLTESERFGVSSYRPIVKNIDGYNCKSITFVYNCHLINRVNGAEVIRTASLSVNNTDLYTGDIPRRLNINNLQTWKVFNMMERGNTVDSITGQSGSSISTGSSDQTGKVVKEYVRSYFSNNDIILSDGESPYGQGNYNFKLFASGGLYKFVIMERNSATGEIKYTGLSSITGQYILAFKLGNNSKAEFTPTYSENMNLSRGELEFRISEAQATAILGNMGSVFNIINRTSEGDTTIYQGTYSKY